jgi:heme-degrading monooxygenase HmoA
MQVVLIDTFTMPDESKREFLEAVAQSTTTLRRIPGYVEGYIYEKTGGETHNNIVTTTVWQDEQAFENARTQARVEFKKIGFDPANVMSKLQVQMQRGIYKRSPY